MLRKANGRLFHSVITLEYKFPDLCCCRLTWNIRRSLPIPDLNSMEVVGSNSKNLSWIYNGAFLYTKLWASRHALNLIRCVTGSTCSLNKNGEVLSNRLRLNIKRTALFKIRCNGLISQSGEHNRRELQ